MMLVVASALAQEEQLSPEDVKRAKVLFEQGEALYAEARFDEAAAAFQLSYALSRKPLLLYNMASCYERLGEWDKALDALERYRPYAAADEVDAIERRLANARAEVEEVVARDRALAEAREQATAPAPAPTTGGKRIDPVPVALFSAGAISAGAGTFFTVRTLNARSDWKALCVDGDPTLCPVAADPLVRRDNTSGLAADLSWLLAAGALTAGLVVTF